MGYVGCYECFKDINEENIIRPDIAADFAHKTRIDALAVAVGNSHGAYKGDAKLNFSMLNELNTKIDVPLVMHGGSRLSREDFRNSIQSGISKINIATDMSSAAVERLKEEFAKASSSANYVNLMAAVKKGVKDSVRRYMLNFDCISKAI
ncbi:D-tagatose-1,6-bisphosphate aldolase subunit GatY [bioreactor metagenome]|uniref:D-tagatose-1,6-bisphosphate aldolase subunit GatY n=1 Tax=bioreactor metagenome TaxID=1076179 RepID=A0A644ZRW9_9ZZZZ